MFERWRLLALPLFAMLLSISNSQAEIIGNWSGSSRSWNSPNMSTIKSTMTTAGHTVEADEAITALNLANNDVFIIGEPSFTPTAGELAALASWVNGGGILVMLADSGNSGLPALNNISTAIGSLLSWSGSASSVTPLASGNFASEGPPFNIVGQTPSTTAGTAVHGGNSLSGDFVHFQQIGSGYVYGFADRLDHNFFNPNAGNTNGQLFLNIVNGAGDQNPVPAPSGLVLAGISAFALASFRFGRKFCQIQAA